MVSIMFINGQVYILEAEELEHLVGNLARAKSRTFFPLAKEAEITRPWSEFVHFSQDAVVVSYHFIRRVAAAYPKSDSSL